MWPVLSIRRIQPLWSKPLGVAFQAAYGVPLGVNGMGKQHQLVIALVLIENAQHLLFDLWANGRTGNEKEVGKINFTLKSRIRHKVAVLINESEIWNRMVHGILSVDFVLPQVRQRLNFGLLLTGKYD
jgi:hypothetical protein